MTVSWQVDNLHFLHLHCVWMHTWVGACISVGVCMYGIHSFNFEATEWNEYQRIE